MEPVAMSFEAQIGLALKGLGDWKQLRSTTAKPAANENENIALQSGANNAEIAEVEEVESEESKARRAKYEKKMNKFKQVVDKDAGHILETIGLDALAPGSINVTWDQDPELLCSYNWQASTDKTNTIFVPGEPAKWHQPSLPHTLDRDSGIQYNDYNYARQPKDPYSPMFHALSVMNPDYQFNDVDVLADRNSLRTLLEYTQGKGGLIRLDIYLVYNTLVILRNEQRWWKSSDGHSYGYNFERFFTQPTKGMEDATSHYRAIRYPMGPLNVVCRFEADAYDDGIVSDELTESEAAAVSGGLASRAIFEYRAPIRVLQQGHIVPTAQIVELKTQSHVPGICKPVACQDQLWFGRTSLLFTGPYDKDTGVVKHIKQEDAKERVKKWEENQQEPLRKLVTLLSKLRAVLKRERRPNYGAVLVRDEKNGPLTVRTMEGLTRGAFARQFRETHWSRTGPQAGAYRGQRGVARGPFNAPRGRGQSVPRGRGQSVPAHGYGQANLPQGNGQAYPPHGYDQVNPIRGYNQYNLAQGYGQTNAQQSPGQFNPPRGGGHNNAPHGQRRPYASRGRGHTERQRSPDYGRLA